MAPDFALPSSSGEYHISDLRGSRNLVLVMAGESAQGLTGLLQALSEILPEVKDEEAEVFVIVRGDAARAEAVRARDRLSLTCLADAEGQVHARYGTSAVYIVDRYGEIYSAYHGAPPGAPEIMASLRHINAECPE
jgi:peroxiredoxin